MLDEPAAGLNHSDKQLLAKLLRRVADAGIAVVLAATAGALARVGGQATNEEGFLVANGDFTEALGPAFWERRP